MVAENFSGVVVENMRAYGMVFSARRWWGIVLWGPLYIGLAIHVDVEILLGFTFQNRAAQIFLLHVFAEIPLLYVTIDRSIICDVFSIFFLPFDYDFFVTFLF